MAGYLF